MNPIVFVPMVVAAALGAAGAWLACRARASGSIASLVARLEGRDATIAELEGCSAELDTVRVDNARLATELDSERRSSLEKVEAWQRTEQRLREAFQALSLEALRSNSKTFLDLVKTQLGDLQA